MSAFLSSWSGVVASIGATEMPMLMSTMICDHRDDGFTIDSRIRRASAAASVAAGSRHDDGELVAAEARDLSGSRVQARSRPTPP